MSSRVFVTQQPRPNKQGWTPNLTPATKYGAIHYVFAGGDRPYSDPDGAIFQATEALADFDPRKDYLLWPNTGDPAAMIAVMSVLARKGISSIKFLNWERKLSRQGERNIRQGFYTPILFNLPTQESRN
jgi:hypothetical protein